MNQHQRRTEFELSDNRRITFYPVVWNQETTIFQRNGSYREMLLPGMFAASLADPRNEVVATVDHDPEKVLAKRTSGELLLTNDPHGVFASLWLPETPLGDAVLSGVKEGTIWGCSCGWEGGENSTTDSGVVQWRSGRLFDVCVVMTGQPAYAGTEVNLRTHTRVDALLARLRLVKFNISRLHTFNR
ncbi:HK97 family phage prohead protease [Gemmata sp. G18]|uniref:HK97 family phage prohead protease n=1 Tax=Gemmata palustris TaxID=2822762 RepID=A0ABS5BML7_9BACT|nr:HK97 family phage prohead protease [Gemmata palustris]MBP3954915.1 HK97 family phage prohead protease [Gemmata palustris]